MICPNCGREYDDKTVFCVYCGVKCISNLEKQSETQKPVKNKAVIGIVVAMCIVCVVLWATLIVLFFSKGRNSENTANIVESETTEIESEITEEHTEENTEEQTEMQTEEQVLASGKFSVALQVVDSTVDSLAEGTIGNIIPNANVYIREGADAYSGGVIQTATTDLNGQANVDLKSGTYTVQIYARGYSTAYYALEVGDKDVSLNCYVEPNDNNLNASSDKELYERFFNKEIGAIEDVDSDYEFYYDTTEYTDYGWEIPEIKWFDLDNDGKDEPYWNEIGYGITAIDARDGKLFVIAQGDGTAMFSSYTVYDGETYLVTSDTTHVGRETYNLRKLNGNGEIVDEFDLGAEYWDEPDDKYNENSDFYYRGEEITMEEYESLRNAYFGY
jgi:hypothetical protein